MNRFVFLVLASLLVTGPAKAQSACPAPSANSTVMSATATPELEPARLMLDQAATVTLHPVGEVRFVAAPEKRADVSSYGGMLVVDVREAGTYQIALSAGAWIDVLKDGMAVASAAHDHGAGCKIVSFALQPGRHVIQLSGNKEDTVKVLVARK